jgi:hypothetical protein
MMHCDIAFEAQGLKPVLVVNPEVSPASANECVPRQPREISRNTVPRSIIAAAIQRPIVDAQLSPDEPNRLLSRLGAPQ